MLDNILDNIKGQVVSAVTKETGLTVNQAEQSFPIAKDSISSGIMGAVSGGNISELMGMFGGGGGSSAGGMMQNMVYQGIASNFISSLTSKLGIPESMAKMVSSTALPMIMSKLQGKVTDDNGKVDQSSLMNMIGGDNIADNLKDQASDMLKNKANDLLGGIFGK